MNQPPHALEPSELAQRCAFGEATEAERAFLEERVAAGDERYAAEWNAFRPAVEAMLAIAPPVRPDPATLAALRERMRDRRDSPAFTSVPEAGDDPVADDPTRMVTLRRADIDWRESGVEGVQLRNLFIDRDHGRLTLLIRMAPGAVYPDHDHPGVEECMVLEGDLSIAGVVLHAGDYLRTPAGGAHGEPRTESGCLLLVTTPIGDAA